MSTDQVVHQLNEVITGFSARVHTSIANVDMMAEKVKATANKAYNEIKQFKTEMVENEQMQNAQEGILRINQIIRERFFDYDAIRKASLGIIKDCDISLVREKTIAKLSEELWITSSRYWLSYSLIALSAWVNDNQKLAQNAIGESFRIDAMKTSLYFCLLNLRFQRMEAAHDWLVEYFKAVVPDDLKEETAVMIEAYIHGIFKVDRSIENMVQEVVDGWMNQINLQDEIHNQLYNAFLNFIKNTQPGSNYSREFIDKYIVNCEEMKFPYYQASKYDTFIKMIKDVDVENIVQSASNYKARIDSILKDLVTNYDEEELELKQEQEYYELIIKNKGKEEVAEQQFNEMLEQKKRKQNIGQKCTNWALYAKNVDVHIRKFGFQHTKTWFLEALNDWSNDFEKKFPEEYTIKIEKWEKVSNGDDADELEISLREHLEKNKFKIKFINALNIILALLTIAFVAVGIILTFTMKDNENLPITLGIVFGLGGLSALLLLLRCLLANRRFNKKVNALLDLLRGTMVELSNYRKTYYDNRNKKPELFSLIENL
ncbi:MAG: hypothetical protein IJ194_06635 [Bacilli bacterium]|nr:hypothetical protein [Bacilli bacterium]